MGDSGFSNSDGFESAERVSGEGDETQNPPYNMAVLGLAQSPDSSI